MKVWLLSTLAAAALAAAEDTNPAFAADDSAVVQLSTRKFRSFLEENPLVLTEFFAPWCGYCKQLGPEFSKAADLLNATHPKIRLAQIDCTVEEDLCQKHEIRGYPTLKVMRGPYEQPADYEGPRDAAGIVEYMIKQLLPPVQVVLDVADFVELARAERMPYMVQILPEAAKGAALAEAFGDLAFSDRQHMLYYSIESDALIAAFDKFVNADLLGKEPVYLVIHPTELQDVRVYEGDEFTVEALKEFGANAKVPYFGDINQGTYTVYMGLKLPLAYYFYNTGEERGAMELFFGKMGRKFRGKINMVGLDATQFGRHAEVLNMDPTVVPLFAIQDNVNGRKYGLDQAEWPKGPSQEAIEEFLDRFVKGEVEPIIKLEPLPTEEEQAQLPVVQLVAHNYQDYINDTSKDVFVKYHADWCGHCKRLAPIWEELASTFELEPSVVIAHIDHPKNDVDTPILIEGYPTLILYPANGEVDPKTGMRKAVVYNDARELDALLDFVKEKGAHAVDVTEPEEVHDEL